MGEFAAELLVEVREDREVLLEFADRLGVGSSLIKEGSAWLAEKVARLKFHPRMAGEFGTFEALEFISVGIFGKLCLWRALATIAPADSRLRSIDLDRLISRAVSQNERVEERRLELAKRSLLPART